MIAIVSSTIFPSAAVKYGVAAGRLVAAPDERLRQTGETVRSLQRLGIQRIVVADNSGPAWDDAATRALAPARVVVYPQHPFANKGISELYLLLAAIPSLPAEERILKISGRYVLNRVAPPELGDNDVWGRLYPSREAGALFSTRCYLVRNRTVFATFVARVLREVYAHQARIVGPGSLLRIVRSSLWPATDTYPYEDPSYSIEGAAAIILRRHNYRVSLEEPLGLIGSVAGDPSHILRE